MRLSYLQIEGGNLHGFLRLGGYLYELCSIILCIFNILKCSRLGEKSTIVEKCLERRKQCMLCILCTLHTVHTVTPEAALNGILSLCFVGQFA